MTDPSAQQNLKPSIAEHQIRYALMELGLTFADAQLITVYDPEAETAFWRYDRRTGHEEIHIGPGIASQSAETIGIVLRHEILHRSLFNGFGERFAHHELANLTLDICINRLLFEAFPIEAMQASRDIYPPEKGNNLVSLADCTANGQLGNPALQGLWEEIWLKTPDRKLRRLNPSSLYYRLMSLLERVEVVVHGAPYGSSEDDDEDGETVPISGPVGRAIREVFGDLRKRLPSGSDLGKRMEEFSVVPARIGTSEVEDFIRRIDVQHVVDATAEKIRKPMETRVRVQPYPMFPSRLGLIYQIAGISEAFSLYWNIDKNETGVRLAIGIYVDVSGSMELHFPLVSAFAAALRDFPLRFKVFDTTVRSVEVEEFARGRIVGGGGTDFNEPIIDFIEDRELMAGVLLTDGEGDLDAATISLLRESRKRLFVVFLGRRGSQCASSPLAHCASDTTVILV
jgi:hypothetical protein